MPSAKYEIKRKCEECGNTFLAKTLDSRNCTTAELAEKYGERTLSRLKASTHLVVFAGEDLRHA